MELLVVVAIIIVLAALTYPVITTMRRNGMKAEAITRMKAFVSATGNYAAQNNGDLPAEDAPGTDDWTNAAKPEAEKAWYNALPKIMGQKSVADFVKEGRPAAFYHKEESLFFLPGANYPESNRMTKPYYAFGINTKLHRRAPDAAPSSLKPDLKLANLATMERTVLFLERGLPGEPRAHPTISPKSDYTGGCKASPKAFVARYQDKGLVAFVSGHVELVAADKMLTPTGSIIWDAASASNNMLQFIWTADPKEDPN